MTTASGLSRLRWAVPTALIVGGVVAVVVGVLLYRHGLASHLFPAYVQGDPPYEVVRYSAPWIASGIVVAAVGALLFVGAARRLLQRAERVDAMPPPSSSPGLADG